MCGVSVTSLLFHLVSDAGVSTGSQSGLEPSTKTVCDYLCGWIRNGHIHKNLTKNGEPQRYSWEHRRRRRRMVNPRDIAGNAEEEEEEEKGLEHLDFSM